MAKTHEHISTEFVKEEPDGAILVRCGKCGQMARIRKTPGGPWRFPA